MNTSTNGHPAWQTILEKIPEAFRPIVEPVLKEWDQGVAQAFEAKNAEIKKYEPFKQFVDNNVPADWLAEAADFAYRFEQDPKGVVAQANQAFQLGYLTPEEAAAHNPGSSSDDDDPELAGDITKHPAFAGLASQISGLTELVQRSQQESEQQKSQQEFDRMLANMREQHGDFDEDYVTALIANGVPAPQALEKYQTMVASLVGSGDGTGGDGANSGGQAGQGDKPDDTAPVVMGGDGSGSGLPQQPIDFGKMKTGDLESVVEQYIQAANNSD